MTFNTGNPVGSTDARDLYDNAQNLDNFSIGQELEYPDRLGVPRKSLAGIRAEVTEALSRLGYQVIGDYAAGLVVQNFGQVFRKDGEFYRAKAKLALPYSLTGDWAVDAPKFVAVGDAVLRQELANGSTALVDAAVVGRVSISIESIKHLSTAPKKTDQSAIVASFHDGWAATAIGAIGGGAFKWNPTRPKVDHDGGSVIDPDRTFPADWSILADRQAWFAPSATGYGCWERVFAGNDGCPEMFGAFGDGVSDDTDSIQAAITSARRRSVKLRPRAIYRLTTRGPCPDGSEGAYCVNASLPVKIYSDDTTAEIAVPANQHGIIITASNVSVLGVTFRGVGAVGTIGHHIKAFGDIDRPSVRDCRFYGVSDAAVNVGVHLNNVLNNRTLPGFDIWAFGPKNIDICDNQIFDCNGDAAIELAGATGGIVSGNQMFNAKGHGVRCVGNRNLTIEKNYGKGLGTVAGSFSALVSCFSGAITPSGGDPIPLYNSDVTVRHNVGRDVLDGLHIGIGAERINAYENDFEARQRPLYVLHSGSVIGRWGVKDSRIVRNRFSGGSDCALFEVATGAGLPPANAPLLNNVRIEHNRLDGFTANAIRTLNQSAANPITGSNIRNNDVVPVDSSGSSAAYGLQLTFVQDSDLSGNETPLTNGRDSVVYQPTNNTYTKRNSYRVTRSVNQLVSQSRRPWRTGQLVIVATTGTLPAGLTTNTPYYLIAASETAVGLATSITNAFAGTGVTLTSDGSGEHYIVPL